MFLCVELKVLLEEYIINILNNELLFNGFYLINDWLYCRVLNYVVFIDIFCFKLRNLVM